MTETKANNWDTEVKAFTEKLAAGISKLSRPDDIETGSTPRKLVYQQDQVQLFHYQSELAAQGDVPLLIVYALVNRPYMLDLQPGRSFIARLLEQGKSVYLIDWGSPEPADRYLELDDYINGYLHDVILEICKLEKSDTVNLMGVCQGGTLSLCYSAMQPQRVNSLITLVTPVDFKTPDNLLSRWIQRVDVDQLVDTLGNIPGQLLNTTFASLKPFRQMGQKYVHMVDFIDDQEKMKDFMRMEKWINDSPPQAGEAFRQFLKDLYQENKLVAGGLVIGKQQVDLSNIRVPILNVFAEQDHLVPQAASRVLGRLIGSEDYSELNFPGGHIGLFVSARSKQYIPAKIAEWLNQRS